MAIAEARNHSQSSGPASNADELAASLLVKKEELEVDKLFKACVKLQGSDLHLKVGTPPIVRVKGDLKPLNRPPIDVEEMVRLLIPMLDDRNRRIFEEEVALTFLTPLTSKVKIGDSGSTCSSSSVGQVWLLDESITLSPTLKACSCPPFWKSYANSTKG